MSESSTPLARRLSMPSHARHHRRGQRALLRGRVLRVLAADIVAARTAAGMTPHEVAKRMRTTKSAVSRPEIGRYARPTLDTVEMYALAVGTRVEIRVRPGWQGRCAPARTMAPANDRFTAPAVVHVSAASDQSDWRHALHRMAIPA